MTVNLSRYFAIDGSFTYSSQKNNPRYRFNVAGGDVTQGLVGLKASLHGKRFSLFAKVRPGFLRFAQGEIDSESAEPPGADVFIAIPHYQPRLSLALDLGGGVEYAVTPKLAIRTEMGDTLVFWRAHFPSTTQLPMTHNLQISNGVYYRFGKTMKFEELKSENPHKFFDKTNLALFSASFLAQAADAITTQRFRANCIRSGIGNCDNTEANPLAQPFVKHGWGGQVALGAIVNATQLGVTWVIHKMGHHRVERFVTVPLTVGSGIAAYNNMQSGYPNCRSGVCGTPAPETKSNPGTN